MTTITLHNDAKVDSGAYDRISRLMTKARPLAEQHSRLSLPDQVTARIVSTEQLIDLMADHGECIVRLAASSFPADSEERSQTMAFVPEAREEYRKTTMDAWPTVHAAMVCRSVGDPEMIIMPEAYAESRATDRYLTGVLVHELTHIAQNKIWPGMPHVHLRWGLQDQASNLPPEQRRSPYHVIEGHAQWVQRQAMKELCGVATADVRIDGEPDHTDRFRELRAGSSRPDIYDQGDAFISALHDAGGYPVTERLLRDENLLPTVSEITDPAAWLKRYAPAMNEA
ncbi:hypothetical protein [Kitasatospora sp. NPDC087315]|uniref:hypothetical protein n=1 Tax=Kitasatospora sp. NPDC087315 TaxID=3364069 RepID=UPI0038215D68